MKFNELASLIANREGKKTESNIGDVREALKITLTVLANLSLFELAQLLRPYKAKK